MPCRGRRVGSAISARLAFPRLTAENFRCRFRSTNSIIDGLSGPRAGHTSASASRRNPIEGASPGSCVAEDAFQATQPRCPPRISISFPGFGHGHVQKKAVAAQIKSLTVAEARAYIRINLYDQLWEFKREREREGR
jgi:hypothetical protein